MRENSWVSYFGTITFNPNYSLEKKDKRAAEIPMMISDYLKHGNQRYYMKLSKEYHKVGQEDDFESPHWHFILYASSPLPIYRVESIKTMLKEYYGRSQFYRMTTLKTKQVEEYIEKDSRRLYELTGQHHFFEFNLEESVKPDKETQCDDSDYCDDFE